MRKLNSVFRLGYYLLIKTVVLPLTERVYFFLSQLDSKQCVRVHYIKISFFSAELG